MIEFTYLAAWSDRDGDSLHYRFTIEAATAETAYTLAADRVRWYTKHFVLRGMDFDSLTLLKTNPSNV